MAKKSSFDVSTGVDLQEVDNAVNQARKEIATPLRLQRHGLHGGVRPERRVDSVGGG